MLVLWGENVYGYSIVFEGLDASGKSTQIDLLVERLKSEGHEVVSVRSPGGTLVGERVRELVLGDVAMHDDTELFLHVACRAELFHSVIRPAMAEGKVVVCSRFFDSLIAYQGRGRGFDIPTIYGLKAIVTGGWNPDLTILLDIPVENSLRRVSDRGGPADKMEKEDARFYGGVRKEFLTIARAAPDRYEIVDAMQPSDVVARHIWNLVERRLLDKEV